jgi:hypothetical protein
VSHTFGFAQVERIRSEANRIIIPARTSEDPLSIAAALHSIVHKSGYSDVVLDFSNTTFISPMFMLPVVALCRQYRVENVSFSINMPRAAKAQNLLINCNWAHLILPERFPDRSTANQRNLSALQFFTADEHFKAVDRSMNLIMQTAAGLNRSMLKALEWSLNEVTDNVINHAESKVGGIMQVMTFPMKERVEFYVVDAGITIPTSLRSGRSDITNDEEALRLAIAEGVTRNKQTNQGNGLFGTFRSCEVSGGDFSILSGNSSLSFSDGRLAVAHNPIPFKGTFVRASINYGYSKLLEEAFIFGGKAHIPKNDYIERVYETSDNESVFIVKNELQSFGSREAGRAGRIKLENIIRQTDQTVVCDFDGVNLISSSFADEVFGKLFSSLGPINFANLCKFKNIDSTVRGLIDRAIILRVRQEGAQ